MPDGPDPSTRFLRDRLARFVDYLRSEGLPVGTGEAVDFAEAVDAIDLLDRDGVRAAAGITLAKSPEALAAVLAAFDRYWVGPAARAPVPWPRDPPSVLGPSKRRPTHRAGATSDATRDPPPTVVMPIGTYSASAPSSPHPLVPLEDREVRALRRGARRFRRQVAARPGRRQSRAHRGVIDLRDTVRRSLRNAGEWVELGRRAPRLTRAEFVLLWDVSGSMREHESRLFALVHAIESTSRRCRVFAFSTRLREISSEVRRHGYRRAVSRVADRIDRADGGTRIGESLAEFRERFGSLLGPETTVVVLSDGWDLGDVSEVGEELGRIRRRVRRVVWVTPYTRRPGFEARVGALRSALDVIDELLGPEDFASRWPLRPFRAPAAAG